MKNCDVIILRTFGAEHANRPGFWCSWYCDNVLAGDLEGLRARVRRYWKGDCIDAWLVPDTDAATEIAFSYEGPHRDEVRYIAGCLALGRKPFDDEGGGNAELAAPEPAPLSPGGITLDALIS